MRSHKVVGKFVEFFGTGIKNLTLADRATISNMAPEYGATCGFFPTDNETINYYIFGRSQSDYSRSYVRIQNDPKVYLTDQNVSFMLQTRPTYWGQKPKENIPIESDTTKIKKYILQLTVQRKS